MKLELFNVLTFLCLASLEEHEHVNYDYEYERQFETTPPRARTNYDEFCSLSCGNDKNIACVYSKRKCFLTSTCVLIKLNKEQILAKHNNLRSKFAIGTEDAAGGIKVSNMMVLRWDDDLAFTAQCNLVDCGDVKEDLCHITPRFGIVGQNVWNFTDGQDVDCKNKAVEGIQSWYDEVKNTSLQELRDDSKSFKGNVKTKHFAQVIWAMTTHVGCAMTKQIDRGDTKCKMTCNYAPGLQRQSRSFNEGVPCSECPDSNCQATGLCWSLVDTSKSGSYNSALHPHDVLLIMAILFVHKSFNK